MSFEYHMAAKMLDSAVDRMARAAVKDSLPTNGMFNSDQLDQMAEERMPCYRSIATVMLHALLR